MFSRSLQNFLFRAIPAILLTSSALAQDAPAQDAGNKLYKEACEAFDKNDFVKAQKNFEEILKQAQRGKDRLGCYLGLSLLGQKKYAEAEKALLDAIKAVPADEKSEFTSKALLGLAKIYVATKKEDQAIKTLKEAATDSESRAEAGFQLAGIYRAKGDNAEALKILTNLAGSSVITPEQTMAAINTLSLIAKQKDVTQLRAYLDFLRRQYGTNLLIAWYYNRVIAIGDENLQGSPAIALALYQEVPPSKWLMRKQSDNLALMSANIAKMEDQLKKMQADSAAKSSSIGNAEEVAKAINAGSQMISQSQAVKKAANDAIMALQKSKSFDADVLMRKARGYFLQQRHREALLCFKEIREKYASEKKVAEQAAYGELVTLNAAKKFKEMEVCSADFLAKYPASEHAEPISMVLAEAALKQKGVEAKKKAADMFGKMYDKYTQSKSRSYYLYMKALAQFQSLDWKASRATFADLVNKHKDAEPKIIEDSMYRVMICGFLLNSYKETIDASSAYLEAFPRGVYKGDVIYRLSYINFQDPKFEGTTTDLVKPMEDYVATEATANDSSVGTMLSLVGDVWARQASKSEAKPEVIEEGKTKSLDAYKRAIFSQSTPDVIQYAMDAATNALRGEQKWDEIAELHTEFLKQNPEHPLAINSTFWVAKAYSRSGKNQEAIDILVPAVSRKIDEPENDTVEQVIDEIVKLQLPKRKKRADLNPRELEDSLTKALKPAFDASEKPTGKARAIYAQARLKELLKLHGEANTLILSIAKNYKPEDLSAALLVMCADALMKAKDLDKAEGFFERLSNKYSETNFADAGPVGLADIAMRKDDPGLALSRYNEALNGMGSSRFKEATLGKAEALIKLKRYDEAEKLCLDSVGNKEFRGLPAAKFNFYLGDLMAARAEKEPDAVKKKDFYAKANGYYQRVFVGYSGFPDIASSAMLLSGDLNMKVGQKEEAIKVWKKLAETPKFKDTSAVLEARKRLLDNP